MFFEQVTTNNLPEYPCWLLQSVLLQGYMYITLNHICFYAYLPKKSVSKQYTQQLWNTDNRLESSGEKRLSL